MNEDIVKYLKSVEVFSGIDIGGLKAVMACFSPSVKRYSKGEIAAIAGDPLNSIGVVLDGEMEITRENAAGDKSIIAFVLKGKTFGEVAAFSGQRQWPSTVTARKDSLLLFLPPDRFTGHCQSACAFHKTLIQNMLKIISDKAVQLNRKVMYLEIKGMRAKLCTYLLDSKKYIKAARLYCP